MYRPSFLTGLDRHQRVAQHLPRQVSHLAGSGAVPTSDPCRDDVHATDIWILLESPLAPASGMDLGLQHDHRITRLLDERSYRGDRLIHGSGHLPQRNGDPVGVHQLLGLVLVDL